MRKPKLRETDFEPRSLTPSPLLFPVLLLYGRMNTVIQHNKVLGI